MSSLHLLRPFTARQLHLVAGDGGVVAFAVLGGRYQGPSALVHAPTLARRIDDLDPSIRTVVFFDEPVPDGPLVSLIDDMVAAFEDLDLDALVQAVPATEAVKRVEGDLIAEGIDRSSLVSVRCPEVVARGALQQAGPDLGDRLWVNPTELIAGRGGRVGLFDPASALQTLAG